MFEIYLLDAAFFIQTADKNENEDAFLRAAIFYLASAVEAYVNDIAILADNQKVKFSISEQDFLNDRQKYVNVGKAMEETKVKNSSISEKLKYLAKKHPRDGVDILGSQAWENYLRFKSFRNRLVHPKADAENITNTELFEAADEGLKSIVKLLSMFSKCIFNKPLRPRLLELIE